MEFNLWNDTDKALARDKLEFLIKSNSKIELKKINKARTITQNRALHLWFKFISDQLNESGATFSYEGLTQQVLELPYTEVLVKECMIKPIVLAMFEKNSTTKLTTQEINDMITVVNKFFGDKGIYMPFPSIETMQSHYDGK